MPERPPGWWKAARRRTAGNLALLATSVSLTVVAAELLLRLILPSPTVYRPLPPGRVARFHNAHSHGVAPVSTYSINSMGVRGREWSGERASSYRVLCLGGSTTECLVNDDTRVWTALLEQRLRHRADGREPWVGNAGRSGLSTRHHVLQMEHLLPVYDPDAVVVMAGMNDLGRRLKLDQSWRPWASESAEARAYVDREAFAVAPGRFALEWPDDPWRKRTRLWLMLRRLKGRVVKNPDQQDTRGGSLVRWRELRATGRRTASLPSLEVALDEFSDNLRDIVRLGRQYGARVVLVTQPTLWRDDLTLSEQSLLWLGGVGDFQAQPGALYYEPGALAHGLDLYNERMRAVCRETGTPCADLAARMPRTTQYFWDDCHFTDHAQHLVAEVVAEALR